MSSLNQELKAACLRLRNGSPEGWDRFMVLFSQYTDGFVLAVTDAAADRILVQQGQAQQCLALLRLFEESAKEPKQKPTP